MTWNSGSFTAVSKRLTFEDNEMQSMESSYADYPLVEYYININNSLGYPYPIRDISNL
jgi:hypothetical protein